MDEQLVICAVAAHRSLYDPSHTKYKDVELRNSIWQDIATDLKQEVEACKAKWRTLRDGFTRALRHQREAKHTFPSKARKPWRYQNEMEFLIPFICTRESRASQAEREDHEDVHDQQIGNRTPSPDTEDTGADASADDEDNCPLSFVSTLTPNTPSSSSVDLSQNSSSFNNKRKVEPDTFKDFEYQKCRRFSLDHADGGSLKGAEMLSAPRIAHCQCRSPTEDPTEAFFFSMGQSVKRLPFYLQAQVKMKVCQLVTDAEIECLDSAAVR